MPESDPESDAAPPDGPAAPGRGATELPTETRDYVVLFEDGEFQPVGVHHLRAWCTDIESWLNFMRMVLHDGVAADMTVQPERRDPTRIRVIPKAGFTQASSFERPFRTDAPTEKPA